MTAEGNTAAPGAVTTSYHNHTRWSDGSCTVAEQVSAGRAAGLDEVGISDHYTLSPGGARVSWSMELDRLGEYVADVRQHAADAADAPDAAERPIVRLGIEADFFPETVDTLRELLARHPFDYVIGSVHYVGAFSIDSYAREWQALTPEQVNEKWRLYWTRVRQMAESRVYDFAAHLDLPKKFGFRPTADLADASNAALDALAAADMAIEINTAGWSLPAKEGYPSLDLLRAAHARGIPLLINADAHKPENLTRDFDRARALAREAGYTALVRYDRRQRIPVPL